MSFREAALDIGKFSTPSLNQDLLIKFHYYPTLQQIGQQILMK